jgi:general L-amino acid transport system substrate-binding protein
MMKTVGSIAVCAAAMVALWAAPAVAGPTLDAVKARGKVVCAANGSRMGFSSLDSQGQWQGIDVDTCKAIAAAVLGDAEKVQLVKSTTQNRFTVLQTGEVDVTAANATWTLSRDTTLGIDFVAPTFYDGQGFMVNSKLGVKEIKDLNGATLCVTPGSTSEKVAADISKQHNIKFTPIVIEDQKEINNAFFGGRCDVHIQSTSGLSANRAAAAKNPEEFVILPGVFGKDPMGPAVRQGDPQWRDIVAWTVYAMIQAEESGITSKNVDEMKASGDPDVQRLLGVKEDLGATLGLDKEWAYRIIKQVGNYGEVFDRNVGKDSPLKMVRGINDQWTKGGLMYAIPFK